MEYKEVLKKHLKVIYEEDSVVEEAYSKITSKLDQYEPVTADASELTEKDVMLITYGDSIVDGERPGLDVLAEFLGEYVGEAIKNVHLLPMYPYTSDDGFSVVDYRQINPKLGKWEHVHALSKQYDLMFDAVINHISKSSEWFQKYLQCEKPYDRYFLTCDPDADYSLVTRPRALPLLTVFDTKEGKKHVWTTFSEDQIDLNFGSPDVMAEIIDLLVFYGKSGASFIRLDAIGFMWKELGTTCFHHKKTHEAIKMMKDILREYAPGVRIITETNVPHEDNISYFGNGYDEADLVYQFPLPPLTMHAILSGDATILADWMSGLTLPSDKVTFFNFLSSHDGIGIRPTEGILTEAQQAFLVESTLKHGGRVSYKDNGDGTQSPYELNINYQDALAGPDDSDETRKARFLAAETILLSIQGMPAIYVHSLLGSRNDYFGMTSSDIPRRINREQLELSYLKEQLTKDTNRKEIFDELIRRLMIRRQFAGFAPSANQEVLKMDHRVLAVKRSSPDQEIYALINVSGENVVLTDPRFTGVNLLSLTGHDTVQNTVRLKPYEAAWILHQDN